MGVLERHHLPWEINDRKYEIIAFVVNASMNVTVNNFYI